MKKVTFLLLSLLIGLTSASAVVTNELYLTGEATPVGWTSGAGAIQMTKLNDDVFTWTGKLKGKVDADAGKNRFAFLVDGRQWYPRIVSTPTPVQEHVVLTSGVEVDVYKYTSEAVDGGKENTFKVAEDGEYTIDINLNTMKMTCTKTGDVEPEPEPVPNYGQLFIAGGGTNPDGNWDNQNPIEMVKISEGRFIWTGNLYNNTEARADGNLFKFINIKGSWGESITPEADHDVVVDTEFKLKFKDSADKKFKVTEAGVYTIEVDLKEMKIYFFKDYIDPTVDLEVLYLVGSATEAGWDPDKALEMTKLSNGVFTWKGNLTAESANEFKFLNLLGVWSNTINPMDGDIEFAVNTDYNLNFRPYEGSPNDYKFKVKTAGAYQIDVNLNTMVIQIKEGGAGIKVQSMQAPFDVEIANGSINVIAENGNNVQSVNVFDISGRNLSNNNLSQGIYILKVKYNDKEYTQKVMIQK